MYYAYLRFPQGADGPVTSPSADLPEPAEPRDADAPPASTPAAKKPKQ
jgi:hypothetical protein